MFILNESDNTNNLLFKYFNNNQILSCPSISYMFILLYTFVYNINKSEMSKNKEYSAQYIYISICSPFSQR